MFADDVIEALLLDEGKQSLLADAMKLKMEAVDRSVTRGNPSDDLKSAAGEIYNHLKNLLDLRRCGNTTDAFMRDTLAPLILPHTSTYQALTADVVDRIK